MIMRVNLFPSYVLSALWTCTLLSAAAAPAAKPNIVLILADDLGYGDLSCYGATKVATPNLDRIASQGLRFTDAHASSATCTPSRYALLTGEYPWRKRGTGVLPGDAALVIETNQTTLPVVLRKAGYRTAAVGKWHLGLGGRGGPDWNGEIKPGPLELGFDYCFVMPATGDRVPCVFVEDHHVVGLDTADPIKVSFGEPLIGEPTGKEHPELLELHPSHGHDQTIINGISRIGYMTGGKAARWKDEEMADVFTKKAIEFIEKSKASPFFLYFASHDIHVPRVPHPRFVGKSGCGVRGDVIVQFDWCVGQVVDTLERLGLNRNTLLVVSSDNGPVVDDGYQDGAVKDLAGHKPAGPLRGGKYSIFEGGTRVPLLVCWPGRVKPAVSAALVSQIDLLASFAALSGQKLGPGEARDSTDTLAAFLGESREGRDRVVEHAGSLALRDGHWKYIEPGRGAKRNPSTNTELGNDTSGQVYNLEPDLGEARNLIEDESQRAARMRDALNEIRKSGRMPTEP
jgi:arylsulfatase A-like enzyme